MREEVCSNMSFPDFTYSNFGVQVNPKADGQIHRFSSAGKKGDLDGWYVYYNNPDVDIAVAGSWRTGQIVKWCSGKGRLTEEYSTIIKKRTEDALLQKTESERKAAIEAAMELSLLDKAGNGNPYLKIKGVKAYEGVKMSADKETLYIPLYSPDGIISSYQRIFYKDGKCEKRFKSGGRKKGCYFLIGLQENSNRAYLCEGYATGASIHEATGVPVIVAFDGGNMASVADVFKGRLSLTVVADNDEKGKGSNPGKKYAEDTGLPYKMIPVDGMDANDYAQRFGIDALKKFLGAEKESYFTWAGDYMKTPAPMRWLIKNWIPEHGLAMVYGASNSGKTFVVLDMLLTLSSGLGSWQGMKAKKATCLYLAGEGAFGLKARIALWVQEHGIDDPGFLAVGRGPKWLNQAEDLAFIDSEIQKLNKKPDVIAIDTLNRFFSGDENSSQEIGGFLESLSQLMEKWQCSVILIHHTGVSREAEGRARGSSALNAAVDVSILVTNEEGHITISQTKQKDAELQRPIETCLRSASIEGWLDEDGQEVRSAVIESTACSDRDTSDVIGIVINAWLANGGRMKLDHPAVNMQEIRDFMKYELNWGRDKIKNAFRKGQYRFLSRLIESREIQIMEQDIILTDPLWTSMALLSKCAEVS